MGISLHEFKSIVLDRLLGLLWRQWSAIGVPGQGDVEDRRVIDPEALLLLSLTVARFDARLFDEILGWMEVNGPFMNVQRLGNLEKRYDFRCKAQLSAVSHLLSKESNSPVKWGRLSAAHYLAKPEPLFFMKNGRPLPVPDEHSPEFAAHGLLRGPIRPRGHAKLFPAKGMPSLLLRLRALLGVNARCELLCLLGAVNEISPSEIARQTGYFPRTVQNALSEMAQSGLVRVRTSGREKSYWLQPGVFDALLKPEGIPVQWFNWAPLFRALEMLWLGLTDPKRQALDPLLLASELRRLSREMRPLLGEAGMGYQLDDDSPYHGEAYAEVFLRDMKNILNDIIR